MSSGNTNECYVRTPTTVKDFFNHKGTKEKPTRFTKVEAYALIKAEKHFAAPVCDATKAT